MVKTYIIVIIFSSFLLDFMPVISCTVDCFGFSEHSVDESPPASAPSSSHAMLTSTCTDAVVASAPQSVDIRPNMRLQHPYVLPVHSLRDTLKMSLSKGELLTSGQRTELLEAIYLDVTKYTL